MLTGLVSVLVVVMWLMRNPGVEVVHPTRDRTVRVETASTSASPTPKLALPCDPDHRWVREGNLALREQMLQSDELQIPATRTPSEERREPSTNGSLRRQWLDG